MAYAQMKTGSSKGAGIGEKIIKGAEIAGALKTIYDVGSMIYRGAQAAAPVAAIAGAALL